MDLGITPVVSSSYFMQFFTLASLINPDFSIKEDKVLYDSLQKLIAIVLTVAQALVQILTGYYGPFENLSKSSMVLIIMQLTMAGIIVILLDEMLQKGYGFGNGVNLFIVTNVCERIVWNAISPKVFYTGRGLEFEGSLVSIVHVLFARKNKFSAIKEILFRDNLPNLSTLLFTLSVFFFVIYVQSICVEIPIISRKHKGVASIYPINLMYSSTNPIFIQSSLVTQFFNISKLLYKFFPRNFFVKLLGIWETKPRLGYTPVSGLCYYILPPSSYKEFLTRPVFFMSYLFIMLGTSAFLSVYFLDSQDDNAAAVYKRIKNQDMQVKGLRDANAVDKLNEYIKPASFLSGLITSAVVQFCDLFNVIGSGSNIFLATNILNQYIKLLAKESLKGSGKVIID